MQIAHILMAILSTWRITEAVTQDVIFKSPRDWWATRFEGRSYADFLICPKCVSAWAGLFSTAMLFVEPRVNWPLGLSMTCIVWGWFLDFINYERQRKITIMPDLNRMEMGMYTQPHVMNILEQFARQMKANPQHSNPAPPVQTGRNGK